MCQFYTQPNHCNQGDAEKPRATRNLGRSLSNLKCSKVSSSLQALDALDEAEPNQRINDNRNQQQSRLDRQSSAIFIDETLSKAPSVRNLVQQFSRDGSKLKRSSTFSSTRTYHEDCVGKGVVPRLKTMGSAAFEVPFVLGTWTLSRDSELVRSSSSSSSSSSSVASLHDFDDTSLNTSHLHGACESVDPSSFTRATAGQSPNVRIASKRLT